MVQLTQPLLKYIPEWYKLKQSSSNFFKKQALLYMTRFGKKREWSTFKNSTNRYFYYLKGEQYFAAHESSLKRDLNRARIHAACEEHDYHYKYLQPTLHKLDIHLNSAILARLSIYEPKTFKALVDISKEATSESLPFTNFEPDQLLSKEEMFKKPQN